MSENEGGSVWGGLFIFYMAISQIMAMFYWYEYAQDHGFLASVFIGPFVGEIKGLFWIIFIFV